jgi:membrane protease subunit (stomatin/prohibitin family)
MPNESPRPKRRLWLKLGAFATLGVAAGMRAAATIAQAAKPGAQSKRVDENEPQAQALGYKHDAAKVDREKFKNYQPGQLCANCNFYKGKDGDAWGPCDLFAGREVNAKGWCSAWVKKA